MDAYTNVEYISPASFNVWLSPGPVSYASDFVAGVRFFATHSSSGDIYGTVVSSSYSSGTGKTTVIVLPDSGAVYSDLVWVNHGVTSPASIAAHTHSGTGQGGALPGYATTAKAAALAIALGG